MCFRRIQDWISECLSRVEKEEKPSEGVVVAVGSGVRADDGSVRKLDVNAGDRVLFGKFGGTDVKVDGEDLLILRETDILGIVEGKKKTKKSA